MPPRRFCFLPGHCAESQFFLAFQCHHGVSASVEVAVDLLCLSLVSMPPRRFCFGRLRAAGIRRRRRFNATTAFLLPRRTSSRRTRFSCFNATTAFLLPFSSETVGRAETVFQCHHGVSASGSGRCAFFGKHGFQCHHGVSASSASSPALIPSPAVSMPPRRFCFGRRPGPGHPGPAEFQCHHGVSASTPTATPTPFVPRFNATTAFLLRGPPALPGAAATSFQCHHGVSASRRASPMSPTPRWFQCHHGVSASMRDERRFAAFFAFQCHHGVSASWCPASPSPGPGRVSMPPRRFCFSPWCCAPRISCPRFQCHHGVSASFHIKSPV